MYSNLTLHDFGTLHGLNISSALNGSFQFGSELDIFFQPENVLITLYVPVILLSLVANILLIVVAVKCNYTKRQVFILTLILFSLVCIFIVSMVILYVIYEVCAHLGHGRNGV